MLHNKRLKSEESYSQAVLRQLLKKAVVVEDNKPITVIMDYAEYLRLKEIEEDRLDYYSALDVKRKNKNQKPVMLT